jgi:hypothetical protein
MDVSWISSLIAGWSGGGGSYEEHCAPLKEIKVFPNQWPNWGEMSKIFELLIKDGMGNHVK